MNCQFLPVNFEEVYAHFDAPPANLDCGQYCAPYNRRGQGGVSRGPFCCDTRQAVPTVYPEEFEYLQEHTDLWHPWQGRTLAETLRVQDETPGSMLLVECLGYQQCQRPFCSFTCRAFPFFPYITREDWFIGMTYYWQYENVCWVISNLQVVTAVPAAVLCGL